MHEFEGEPVSSSEWVKAYGLGRRGWAEFLYRTTALTASRHTSPSAEAHSEQCPDGATLHVIQPWLTLFFSEDSVGDGTSCASGVEEKIHTHVPQMHLCFSSSA